MPRQKATSKSEITWNPGEANAKQKLFYESRATFTLYGGARGGGKTHAVRIKAVGGAIANPGIRILIMRKTYPELEENHIRPILRMLPPEMYSYNGSNHMMTFFNGSTIKFGHWSGIDSETEYQGQEYHWIFLDEATQFSERAFNFLGGLLRSADDTRKAFFLTANPGGIGHNWVKRLFIDRKFKRNFEDPELDENPDDYLFIPATVDDNTYLMQNSPQYVKMLAQLPEDIRQAHRFGDWDAIDSGGYFCEFSPKIHVCNPFPIPKSWLKYRSFDYGLDKFACYWWAVDEDGRSWCYREYTEKNLIAQDAARKILELTLPSEKIEITYAPPDMWSRQKDTGKTIADVFLQHGVPLIKAENNRVQGHLMIKELLAQLPVHDREIIHMYGGKDKAPHRIPGMIFFNTCKEIISDIQVIQHDEHNPNDCAKEPHEVTHTVDGVRYFAVSRKLSPAPAEEPVKQTYEDIIDRKHDEYIEENSFDSVMCGGEPTTDYIGVA